VKVFFLIDVFIFDQKRTVTEARLMNAIHTYMQKNVGVYRECGCVQYVFVCVRARTCVCFVICVYTQKPDIHMNACVYV